MAHQLRQSLMRLPDPFPDPHFSEQNADGQGVDEYSQCPVGSLPALHTPQQHRAEYHILATGDTTQHLGPDPVEKARCADTQHSCLLPDALTKLGTQPSLCLLHPIFIASM